jgi:hypothetical protein
MMSLDTVSWTARSIIADFMASTVILKRYRDGVYVGTFWEKCREGKGLNVVKHTASKDNAINKTHKLSS